MTKQVALTVFALILLFNGCLRIDYSAKKLPYEAFAGYKSEYAKPLVPGKSKIESDTKLIVLDFPCDSIITDNATIDPNFCAFDVANVLVEELATLGFTTEHLFPYVQPDFNNPAPLPSISSDCIVIAGEVKRVLLNYYDQYGILAYSNVDRAYSTNCIIEIDVYTFKPTVNNQLFKTTIEGFYSTSSQNLKDVSNLHVDSAFSRDVILKAAKEAIGKNLISNSDFLNSIKEVSHE